MSFQLPSAQQELQNRKILEELQQRKKQEKQLLMRQGSQPAQATNTPGVITTASVAPLPTASTGESHVLTVNQRAALQHAHAHSVGYFITQDSSFGNLILPVLPRLENK